MKPIQLKVTAFGPYADEQLFDFRLLGDHNFYLIHGNTGAGKSTVLDAICYGLYGDSSGGERKGEQMRSHHAPATRPTTVVFDFCIGNESYRVWRAPTQERQKKVGSGITKEQQGAKLWRRTGILDDAVNGEVLAERWEEVNCTVQSLIGFTSVQFRQVVVLPQGQFRQFLIANSTAREQILSMLFQTAQYQAVTDALKSQAKQLHDDCEALHDQQLGMCRSMEVDTPSELELLCTVRRRDYEALVEEVDRQKMIAAEAAQKLELGIEHDRLLQARRDAEQAVTVLEAQRETIAHDRERLRRAQQANSLADLDAILKQRAVEKQHTAATHAELKIAYERALESFTQAQNNLAIEQGREAERQTAAAKHAKLVALRANVDALEAAGAQVATAEQHVIAARFAYESAQAEYMRWEHIFQQKDAIALPLRERASQAEIAEMRLRDAEQQHKVGVQIVALQADKERLQADCAQAEQQLAHQNQLRSAAIAELQHLEQAWHTGQAAILAMRLVPGEPCLVCGAVEHPQPAASDVALPDQQDITNQRSAVTNCQASYEQAQRTLDSLQKDLIAVQAKLTTLVQESGDANTLAPDELSAKLEIAKNQRLQATEAVKELPGIDQEISAARSQLEQARIYLQACDHKLQAGTTQLQAERAVLSARQTDIPPTLRHRQAYEQALQQAERLTQALVQALERATEQATQAQLATASAQSALTAQTQMLEIAHTRYVEQQREFVERVQQAGFVDQDDYRLAIATDEQMRLLDNKVQEYAQQCILAANTLQLATAAAANIEQPDLTQLETASRTAEAAYQSAREQSIRLHEHLLQSEQTLIQVNQLAQELERKEERYTVVSRLASVAAGETGNGVSFQRFMLGSMLDEVLVNASERLRWMSRERYMLERTDENDDRRRAGGLDLQIFDGQTGQARKAATLSGGESFLAALALALGLGDVVQSRSGGIHLDTMFVDEGFGSLDDSTLDLAIEALMKLQQRGRMVGIISHVAELRQRISARLEITAAPGGSSARFVIAAAS